MLKLKNVKIVLNLTVKQAELMSAKIIKAKEKLKDFMIERSVLDFSTINAISKIDLSDNLSLQIKQNLVPTLQIEDKYFNGQYNLSFYDDGILNFKVEIYSELVSVRDTNNIINHALQDNVFLFKDEYYNISGWFKYIYIQLYLNLGLQASDIDYEIIESYSIVQPEAIKPRIQYDKLYESIHEIDIYEAAIRRMPNMAEARIDIARKEQVNLSLYKDDLIFLNYHNLFVYVEPNKSHINASVYCELNIRYKIYLANLLYLQKLIDSKFSELNKVPNKLKALKKASSWLDEVRFKYMVAKEKFEKVIEIAALRISWFNDRANSKYGIGIKQEKIENNLNLFETLISRRLALLQERQLQNITAIIAAFSVIVTIIGIVLPIFLN